MKAKLVYGIIFGGAFVLVTVVIIMLNSMFNNIFSFDFSPPSNVKVQMVETNKTEEPPAAIPEEPIVLPDEKPEEIIKAPEVAIKKDSVKSEPKMELSVYDSLNILKEKIALLEKQAKIKNTEPKQPEIKQAAKKEDSVKTASLIDSKKLEQWAKSTAKLYEAMDPKKAAKIIKSYSDNESREVLYKMNKKKAAKILSELDPETARRITRAL